MFNDLKIGKFLKSKTILFSALLAVFGVVEMNLSLLKGMFSEDVYGIVFMIVSAIVAILRVVTTTALKNK